MDSPSRHIDEVTASIDAVLAEYDEGGLGWSQDGGWEFFDPGDIDWEALRLANFDRNPPIHGPWLNVIPPRLGATEQAPEYTGWYGQWADQRPNGYSFAFRPVTVELDFTPDPAFWEALEIAAPYGGGPVAPTTEDVA